MISSALDGLKATDRSGGAAGYSALATAGDRYCSVMTVTPAARPAAGDGPR